eukprot:scaffold8603_cov155-Skeletonema_menzelii.AAC.3
MSVRFDQVEVFELVQYSDTTITEHQKKIYTVDNFESKRKNKRRTIKQFHLSDLYREEIWVIKQKKPQKAAETFFEVDESCPCEETENDISSPSTIVRLAIEKVKEANDSKMKRRRNKRLFQIQKQNKSLKSALLPIREGVSGVF